MCTALPCGTAGCESFYPFYLIREFLKSGPAVEVGISSAAPSFPALDLNIWLMNKGVGKRNAAETTSLLSLCQMKGGLGSVL